MSASIIRRRDQVRRLRSVRPSVEGFESRQLLSAATIAGMVTTDVTGNGFSADDTAKAGVTIDLMTSGNSKVIASTKTAANGTYSFAGLSAGKYTVAQITPSGAIATGGLDGYAVTLKSGGSATGENFDDFTLPPEPSLSDVTYEVTTPSGDTTTVTSLRGNVQQGDTVTASFDLKTAELITLVAYTAPNTGGTAADLQQQAIYDEASATGLGRQTLTVTIPDGYFQLDFVAGPAIDHLETNPNIEYHAQDRFIDGLRGGTQADPAVAAGTLPIGLRATADVALQGGSTARKH